MAVVLTSADYPSIRQAIDIRLDEIDIPDTTIALDIYAGFAVRRVVGRLPNPYDVSLDPTVKTACIFSCAALLIPAMKQIQNEQIAGHEKTFKVIDWDKKIRELEGRIDQIVGSILVTIGGVGSNIAMPGFFTVAKANRADRW